MKTVLIVAGSDPGAGAGLQQDLKTATLLGAYGLTVVTALTVQNSLGLQAVHPVAEEVVAAQLDALLTDFPVHAVKIGMVGTGANVRVIGRRLRDLTTRPPVVLDPVLAAGRGGALLEEEGIALLKAELFPLATILTPNVPEAEPPHRPDDRHTGAVGGGGPGTAGPGACLGPGQRRALGGRPGGCAHRWQKCLSSRGHEASGATQPRLGVSDGHSPGRAPGPGSHCTGGREPGPGVGERGASPWPGFGAGCGAGEPLRRLLPGSGPATRFWKNCRPRRRAWSGKISRPSSPR